LTDLLLDAGARSVLAEMPVGNGLALYGGMTVTIWHSPQPDADDLRANILVYGERAVVLPEPSGTLGLAAGTAAVACCARHRRRARSRRRALG
jgi:hypothetical protein